MSDSVLGKAFVMPNLGNLSLESLSLLSSQNLAQLILSISASFLGRLSSFCLHLSRRPHFV